MSVTFETCKHGRSILEHVDILTKLFLFHNIFFEMERDYY